MERLIEELQGPVPELPSIVVPAASADVWSLRRLESSQHVARQMVNRRRGQDVVRRWWEII